MNPAPLLYITIATIYWLLTSGHTAKVVSFNPRPPAAAETKLWMAPLELCSSGTLFDHLCLWGMDCYFHFTEEITNTQRGQVNSSMVPQWVCGRARTWFLDSSASEFFHSHSGVLLNNSHIPALEGREDAFWTEPAESTQGTSECHWWWCGSQCIQPFNQQVFPECLGALRGPWMDRPILFTVIFQHLAVPDE